MTEEITKEVNDLVEMLNALALIKDKGQRQKFKSEIRYQLNVILKLIEKQN